MVGRTSSCSIHTGILNKRHKQPIESFKLAKQKNVCVTRIVPRLDRRKRTGTSDKDPIRERSSRSSHRGNEKRQRDIKIGRYSKNDGGCSGGDSASYNFAVKKLKGVNFEV